MKNSSKVFLVAFLAIIIGLIVLMSIIRYNLYNKNDDDYDEPDIELTEQIREVGDFTAINARKNIEITIAQDTFTEVKVLAEEYLQESVITDVKDNVLYIYSDYYKKNDKKYRKQRIRVYVTLKDLEKVEAYRGSLIKSIDTIKGNDLDVFIDNGAICTFIINYNMLKTDISNGAIFNVEGHLDNLEITAINGGMYKGRELTSNYTKINASAGAMLTIGITNNIDINAESGSIINYREDTKVNVIELGSGAQLKKY